MINVNGALCGTTESGGKFDGGTVFCISTTDTEHVLHSFGRGYDGLFPEAGLLDVKGSLYGTTILGGGFFNNGAVFRVSPKGKEKVLWGFNRRHDGNGPSASLVDDNGLLYGTTPSGGTFGPGTVFAISTTGSELVLHNFGSGSDGRFPYASLIKVNGTLYGTTTGGGTHGGSSGGAGTVFALRP